MGWKKVITSGSHAELAQVTASRLNIPQNTTTTTGLDVLVDRGDNVISKIAQSLIQGTNTEFAAGQGFALDTSPSPQVFTLQLSGETGIDHDLIPHTASGAHINWLGANGTLSPSNYENTQYSGSDGTSGLHITESGGEWITLHKQQWTGVGALGTGDSGGSINWSEDITNTGSVTGATLEATNIYVTESLQTNFPVGVSIFVDNMSASLVNIGEAGDPAAAQFGTGLSDSSGLFISGTFIYNDLAFQEQILQQYTGSHIFGGSAADTSQSFTGNIYVSQGVTSSFAPGFQGTGSGLTNIPSSAVNYQALTFSNSITGSFATQNFDFDTDTSMSISTLNSGLGDVFNHLLIRADAGGTLSGVSSIKIETGSVTTVKVGAGAVQSGSLSPDIINAHPYATFSAAAGINQLPFEGGSDFLLVSTGSGVVGSSNASVLGKAKIEDLRNYLVNQFPTNIDSTGTVLSVSVSPLEGGSTIDGLFLSITDEITTTPIISIGGSITGNINNSHWTGSVLSIANGGTGATTAQDAAQNILGWDATDEAGNTIVNSLTMGDVSDTITIPGSLEVNANTTTVDLENFEVKDKVLQIGLGATGAANDIGIQFGQAATQSNAFFYKGINEDAGRLAFGYSLNPDNTIGLSTDNYPMSVFEGTLDAAALVKADQAGMMRVEDNEIYLYI